MKVKHFQSKCFWIYYVLEVLKQLVLTPVILLFLIISIAHMLVEYLSNVKNIDYWGENWRFIFNPIKSRKIVLKKTRIKV